MTEKLNYSVFSLYYGYSIGIITNRHLTIVIHISLGILITY